MLIKIPQNYRYFEDHSGKLFQEIFQHISLSSIKFIVFYMICPFRRTEIIIFPISRFK